ncbi:unnamed protein product [Rangifer tarandus platyrhynchus]|uniref:Uncharacterized protein n=1 Tax=Rangifer tarandus platyrhynchus TaxID=3082113 RepID=A0AC60A939_RANTA
MKKHKLSTQSSITQTFEICANHSPRIPLASLIKNHVSFPQRGGSEHLETPDSLGAHPWVLEHRPSPLNLPLSGAQGWGHTPWNKQSRDVPFSCHVGGGRACS